MSELVNRRTAQHARTDGDQFDPQARVDAELKKIPKPPLWDTQSSAVRLTWLRGQSREIKARLGIK
ncbi:MAG: hypothetical protein WDN46_14730 [Methylocella sp.]